MDKKTLRKSLLSKRNELSKDEIKIKSNKVVNLIKVHPLYIKAQVVALFNAFGSELDLSELIKDNEKTFLYPIIKNNEMYFVKVDANTLYYKSSFNIDEPIGEIYKDKIDFMVVPLLGINKDNYRIGYGKGYYDKFLSKNIVNYKISFVMSFQQINFKEHNYDEKIDEVVII